MEVAHRLGDEIGNIASPQMATARSLIKMPLHFAKKITGNFLLGIAAVASLLNDVIQAAQAFGFFPFKLQQDLFRQGVTQAKGDKVRRAFAFDMGQVTASVNSRAQWLRGLVIHPS